MRNVKFLSELGNNAILLFSSYKLRQESTKVRQCLHFFCNLCCCCILISLYLLSKSGLSPGLQSRFASSLITDLSSGLTPGLNPGLSPGLIPILSS